MKKEILQKFKEGHIRINTETKDELRELIKWIDENTDLKWQREGLLSESAWDSYGERTKITCNLFDDGRLYYGDGRISNGKDVETVKFKDIWEEKGMKTSEFIKRVEELGYETDIRYEFIIIRAPISRNPMANVSMELVNEVDTTYENETVPGKLFDLIVEYAKTPIEDRKEENKYLVRCKLSKLFLQNRNQGHFNWRLSIDHATHFTLKELEELGIDVEHYDLEEVE